MEQFNTIYDGFLKDPAKSPVFIVAFEGVTTRYSTKDVKNPLADTKALLLAPMGGGATITIDQGTSSISQLNFSLIDFERQITKLLAQFNFYNRKVTIKQGFAGMSEVDYVTLSTTRVQDYVLESDNITWRFITTSLLRQQKQNICDAFTTLNGAVLAADVTLNVGSTAKFAQDASSVGSATLSKFYIKIDDEVISYTGITSTSFTGCGRGELGTVAADHDDLAITRAFIVLQGKPFDLALMVNTSTGTSTDGVTPGTNGAFDLLPAHMGLAIPAAQIDSATMLKQQSLWLSGYVLKFELEEKVEAKKFMESEIFQFVNAYPFTDNLGRISAKLYIPPLPTNPLPELNDDNMVGPPKWASNPTSRLFFNEFDLSFDWSFLTGMFKSEVLVEDAASQLKYDQTSTKSAESRGLRTAVIGAAKILNMCQRFIRRFNTPSPILTVRGFFNRKGIEVGDNVALTSTKIPDPVTGRMGIDHRIMEVIRVEPNYQSCEFTYDLADTGIPYGVKYGAISPSAKPPVNFPNYLLATAAQRNYAFIGKKVGTSCIMSNGDPGYFVTP